MLRLPKSSLPNLLTSGGKERKSSAATGAVLRQGEGVVVLIWDHVQTQTTRETTTRETTTRHDDMFFFFFSSREKTWLAAEFCQKGACWASR